MLRLYGISRICHIIFRKKNYQADIDHPANHQPSTNFPSPWINTFPGLAMLCMIDIIIGHGSKNNQRVTLLSKKKTNNNNCSTKMSGINCDCWVLGFLDSHRQYRDTGDFDDFEVGQHDTIQQLLSAKVGIHVVDPTVVKITFIASKGFPQARGVFVKVGERL